MSIDERVRAGATLLDTAYAGWAEMVFPESLVMWHHQHCVLGQLYGDYFEALERRLGAHVPPGASTRPVDYGFCAEAGLWSWLGLRWSIEYRALHRAWLDEIKSRRETATKGRTAAAPAPAPAMV